MKTQKTSKVAHRFVAPATLAAILAAPASANLINWTGIIDDGWDEALNWNTLVVPGSSDIVRFTGPGGQVRLNGNRSVQSLDFGGGLGFELRPDVNTDTLTLLTGDILVTGDATHEIDCNLVLGDDCEWLVLATLEVNGRLTGDVIETTGSGTVRLTGGTPGSPSSLSRFLHLGGDLVIDGGTIELTHNSFTGALRSSNGDVAVVGGAHLDVTGGFLLVRNNSTLTVSGSDTTLAGDRLYAAENEGFVSALVIEDASQMTLTGGLIMGTDGEAELTVRSGAELLVQAAVTLAADPSGIVNCTVEDGATVVCNTLNLGGYAGSSGGAATLTVDSNALVQTTGRVRLHSAASSVVVDGGLLEMDRLDQVNGVLATVSISDPATSSALTVGTSDGDSTFDGVIRDADGGPGSLTKVGTGTFTLTGANTYSGGTFLDGGIIAVSADENLGDATGPLTFGGGGLQYDAAFSLSSSRPITLESGGGTVLTNGFDVSLESTITGTASLSKQGTGMLTLVADNTYGSTTIHGGTVRLGNGGSTGWVSGNIVNNASLVFDRSDDVSFDSIIAGDGDVTNDGPGTLTLAGTNTYSGGTTLNDGTTLANNSTGSATGTGPVEIKDGALLGGSGRLAGAVTAHGGAAIAPGFLVGSLEVGDVTFESGAIMAAELAGVSEFDLLIVSGAATINPGTALDVSYFGAFTVVPGDSFEILSAGSLSGEFSQVIFPDGQDWTIEYDENAGTIVVGVGDVIDCPADLDGSGDVGFGDLVAVLSSWGVCAGCPADLDESGNVGFADLVMVLSAWGAC